MNRVVASSNELVESPQLRYPHLAARINSIGATTSGWRQRFGTMFKVAAVLGVCLIGVAAISYFMLMNQSLRLDEAQSLWQTNHSLPGTLDVVARDVHVPLYHVLLHVWQIYFGNGIETARLFSLAIFMTSIPLFYLLARQILNLNWSLVATVLFSFSPFMNWYGSEIRMYSLLALFSILSQLFYLRILKYNKGWIGYGLTAIIGVYSHYFFFFNLLAQAVFYLLNRRQFAPGSFKKFISIAGLTALCFAPWVYYFIKKGAAENTSPLLTAPSTIDFFNAFSNFAFGFQGDYINTFVLACWPILVLLGFFAIRYNQRFSPALSYVAFAALLPVLAAYVISLTITPFFLSRYMVSVLAPLTLLVVWFISSYPRKLAVSVLALMSVGVILASTQQYASASTPTKEAYRSVAETTTRQAGPEDVVVLSAPFTIYPFSYYYNGNAQIQTLPRWDRVSSGAIPGFSNKRLPSEVNDIKKDHQYLYLVLSQDQGYEEDIKQYFDNHFERMSAKSYSPDLSMYVYRVGYNEVPPLSQAD